jgi:hypothetical protein
VLTRKCTENESRQSEYLLLTKLKIMISDVKIFTQKTRSERVWARLIWVRIGSCECSTEPFTPTKNETFTAESLLSFGGI